MLCEPIAQALVVLHGPYGGTSDNAPARRGFDKTVLDMHGAY